MKFISFFIFLASLSAFAKGAGDNIEFGVAAYFDNGRFQLQDSNATGEFLNRAGARWFVQGRFSESLTAYANLHWLWWRNQATDLTLFHIKGQKFDSELEAAFDYQWPAVHRLKGGFYEFKYNPHSKNLGEYLLRTESYPTVLESYPGVDLFRPSYARIGGVEYRLALGPVFNNTALLYFEQMNMPANDLSAAYFATFSPAAFELGAGFAYRRFLKFSERINSEAGLKRDTAQTAYIKDQGLDTKTLNLMLRGMLDFNALLGLAPQNTFKAYFEIAVLGLKQDTLYYKDIMQRAPVMFGIEAPTGGLLDLLAFEVEYLKNPYYDAKYSLIDAGQASGFSPLPSLPPAKYGAGNLPAYHRDDWKWSLNITKSLNKWVSLKVRAANDHLRLLNWDKDFSYGSKPLTITPKDWYIFVRIEGHN